MTKFEKFKQMDIDEFAEWLDEYGAFDGSPWLDWWNDNYCSKCETEIAYVLDLKKDMEFSWCELHDKCKFFPELDENPDNKEIIRMWLES